MRDPQRVPDWQAMEAPLRSLIDNLPVEFWATDRALRFATQNAASVRNCGPVVGRLVADLELPDDVKDALLKQCTRALDGETLRGTHERSIDGEKRVFASLVAPIVVDDETVGIVGLSFDVTDRTRAEEALRASEAHYREALAQTQATLSETAALYLVSRSLVAKEDLVGLLQAIVDSVAEALPADRVSLIIVDPDARLVTRMMRGGPGADMIVDVPYAELMTGLAGWVFRERRPALSPGSEPDPRESPAVQLRRHETLCGSMVVVPLVHREAILGVMAAINRPEQPEFDERDADLIMSMAGQAAAALESASVEWERTQSALRASEERYRRITETITDYVYRVRVEDGRAVGTVHGPGCVAVTGYTPEELDRDPALWLEMVMPDGRAAVLEQARAVLAGERRAPIEHRLKRRDGAVRWVRNTPVPQLGPDGSLVAYDGLISDITERRTLQEQLLQAQKMESVGRLAGGVAHDFNNLLTAVLGNVELARSDLPADVPGDHPLRADLEEIVKAGERAASLTRQLLSFASKQPIAPVRLDISIVVADSLKMLRRLLGEDIEIVTQLEPALGVVEADPGQIQQLLVNLAVNARDAMPDGGRLVIETANETVDEAYAAIHPELSPWRYVRLSVTDTGVGMGEEVRAHLFEPFFTTKERGKGTGLGLATCHGIVRQIGGEIRVYSEPGQGTTFRILLPLVEGVAAETRADVAASPTPTGTETILVVEDEPAVRRLAVLGLRAQGYTVVEAADGGEALEVVSRLASLPDALVSDVIMPGMTGPELAGRLVRLHPGIRVLLMSGHAEAAILPRSLGEGGIPFLPKPFTPERLARKVREVLDASREPASAPPPVPESAL